ncbi:MarR family winged helix-turn-helix transcriptional regulator [Brachybacterium fresconis]|nr:MarR family transcriptional regulator [Brachybacterium fresconis]
MERTEKSVGELARRVGYLVKQAQSALRSSMDQELRPLGVTVSQYSCLELLHQNPGLTNADLARAAFVSPQSMNTVLAGLRERGLIDRPPTAPSGRRLPAELTTAGHELLAEADARVRRIEERMLSPLAPGIPDELVHHLTDLVGALGDSDTEGPDERAALSPSGGRSAARAAGEPSRRASGPAARAPR